MAKELERDLGLPSVLAISIGAMVGSGIFILPALAMKMAGPAVVLAYLLAGVLVLPAALSKAEMATAMPEAGGTYVYIERGMGPLLGTIAGIGTWFSLSFKGARARRRGALHRPPVRRARPRRWPWALRGCSS
jgi:Amino acid transporters